MENLDFEKLMNEADPDNQGKALSLITYDSQNGKLFFSLIFCAGF